ncbi:putative Sulfotransferase family cytosolic 1B member 1 [Hypsibius exemplaris]|uniref:Sulfotransferase family cytosolic 1B member 1 n=1 Tax=Hypsibius exemplaris TaxID=2072580 RepID=A0A1W0WBT2_HYPEX|nr:putative Sulfotransferase family cytosolic 1B member 1 [Hypsibius exemplaris]
MATPTAPATWAADPFFASMGDLSNTLSLLRHMKPPKVYSDPDYLVEYKGCKVNYPFYLNLDQLDTFEPRSTDVCVAAFPKTGTTWLSAIVYMLANDGDPQSILTGAPLKFKVPYLEMTIPYGDELDQEMMALDHLKKQDGVRTYVTHLSAKATPQRVMNEAKIVYIYRNPKDTIVSMYYFMRASMWFGFHGTMEQLVDDVTRDHCMNGPFFEHLESFWKLRNRSNVFITSYEELMKEPRGIIKKLSMFLGKNMTEAQLEETLHYSNFSQMKENPLTNMAEFESIGIINPKVARFFRTGQVGNWKKHFTPEMNAKVDAWIAKNLAERPDLAGLKFEFEQEFDLD